MFCSFPHRHGETTDMLEHQNEHFLRDFLKNSHFVASKSTFSYEFSLEHEKLQPQIRCFVRGFRQVSAHLTRCHACHGICTLSPLDAALTMRFAQNDDCLQSVAPATKNAAHLLKTSQEYCACHTKRFCHVMKHA